MVKQSAGALEAEGLRTGSQVNCPQPFELTGAAVSGLQGVDLWTRAGGGTEWSKAATDTTSPYTPVWDCTGLSAGTYEAKITAIERSSSAESEPRTLLTLTGLTISGGPAPFLERGLPLMPNPGVVLPETRIEGTVKNEAGEGIQGAYLVLVRQTGPADQTISGESGAFTLTPSEITAGESSVLKVGAAGYVTAFRPVDLLQLFGNTLRVEVTLTALPDTLSEGPRGTLVDKNGGVQEITPVMGTDPETGASSMVAVLNITQDTKTATVALDNAEIAFGRADGQGPTPAQVLGTTGQITAAMVYGNPLDEKALRMFPGRFETNDKGMDGGGQGEAGALVTAGFVKIDLAGPDGREITQFAPGAAARVKLKLNPGSFNPLTKQPVKEGDRIQVWSFNEETGHWDAELNPDGSVKLSIVEKDAQGNLFTVFQTTHLTWLNIDWKAEVCPYGVPTFRFVDQLGRLLAGGDNRVDIQSKIANGFDYLRTSETGRAAFANAPKDLPYELEFRFKGQVIVKKIEDCGAGASVNGFVSVVFNNTTPPPAAPQLIGITPGPNATRTGVISTISLMFDKPISTKPDAWLDFIASQASASDRRFKPTITLSTDRKQVILGNLTKYGSLQFNNSWVSINLKDTTLVSAEGIPVDLMGSAQGGTLLSAIPGIAVRNNPRFWGYVEVIFDTKGAIPKPLDSTAPVLTNIAPKPGSAITPGAVPGFMLFSEPVQTASGLDIKLSMTDLSDGATVLEPTQLSQIGAVKWTGGGATLHFTADKKGRLRPGRNYRLTFAFGTGAAALKDEAGNPVSLQELVDSNTGYTSPAPGQISFTIGTQSVNGNDKTPPTITKVSPEANGTFFTASGYNGGVTFSEAMDTAAGNLSITVTNVTAGVTTFSNVNPADHGAFTWSADNRQLRYTLANGRAFEKNNVYRVSAALTGFTDLAGNRLIIAPPPGSRSVTIEGDSLTYQFTAR